MASITIRHQQKKVVKLLELRILETVFFLIIVH